MENHMLYGSYEDYLKSLKVELTKCSYCEQEFEEEELIVECRGVYRCTECDYKIKTT